MTLIEMIVVLAVVSLLASILLPAVLAAHEAARQMQCAGNLRQLALALNTYESRSNAIPPSVINGVLSEKPPYIGWSFSPQSVLLPDLEQIALFNAINFHAPGYSLRGIPIANSTAASTAIALFLCPSDPLAWAGAGSPTPCSYRSCAGTGYHGRHEDGLFNFNSGHQWADVRDGLTQTLAFSEKRIGTGGWNPKTYSAARDWFGVIRGPERYDPETWVRICGSITLAATPPLLDGGRTWLLGGAVYTNFYSSASPNPAIPDCGVFDLGGTGVFAARSYHPGGVNAAMADGSVRWFANTTNPAVWQALGTRAGGEIISAVP